jgi:hypothetical protein
MEDLDGTVTVNGRAKKRPTPWQIRPTLKAELLKAWDRYPADPHDA